MVRLKDIARVAGVSVTTVSKVLNNRGDEFGISQETQKRVREIARQMNYQPHKEARNLRLGKRYSSILFLSLYEGRTKGAEGFFSHPFFGELMHQIQAEVSRSGCYLSYVAVTEESMPAVRTLIQDRISGVVTCGTMSPELAKLLQRSRLPVAAIEPYTSPAGAFHEVYVDNAQAITLALAYLHRCGYGQLVLADTRLAGEKSNPVFSERVAAWEHHSRSYPDIAASVETFHRDPGTSDITAGEVLGERIIARLKPPFGVVAVNDLTAMGVMYAAQRHGLRIPEDLAVVGIDDIEWAASHKPALTTVRIRKDLLAREAVAYVSAALRGTTVEPSVVRVPVELVVRDTTPKL